MLVTLGTGLLGVLLIGALASLRSTQLACVASLSLLEYDDFHVLIVDNGSTNESVEQIRLAMPTTEILETGVNRGFGGGCNVGIRKALSRGADYIWLVNSDATVDRGALSALVRVANQSSKVGAVDSVLFEANDKACVQLWGGGRVNLCLGRSVHCQVPGTVDFVAGASVLLRSSALKDVGLFDEANFFMYLEDTDLGFRLRKAGWR